MKRLFKWLFILALVAVAAVVGLLLSKDAILKAAVEQQIRAQTGMDQLSRLRQQTRADQHVVGPLAQIDPHGGRLPHGAEVPRSAAGSASCGHRARASTISPTITSWGTSRLSTTRSATAS